MFPKRSWVWRLLCLLLCWNVMAAGILGPIRRDDASPTTTIAPTTTENTSQDKSTATAQTSTESTQGSSVASTGATVTSSASSTATATLIPSALNGNSPSNVSSIYNSTIAEGELPLQPRLTPGWAVAGVILLLTGAVHTLIGIKNNWLHTFFSSAYLAGLSTTVLIVYVMVTPISDGIQGAYVVAVVVTGLILGGGATIFRELTESLGCLLGGFCVSMWLLTLQEGGLLKNTTARVIFITAFTLAGFAFYFSRHTRVYALIGLIAFSGATATVLGIDCFSRAGLKEFWAYIWALNENLFPFGVDTYPLTKGIRVELALNVILCIIGIISQLKLWRIIQAHRAKRAEAREEAQKQRDLEEANLGQQIEEQTAPDRQEWEATYGGRPPASPHGSGDSGIGDMSEKKARSSLTTVQRVDDEEEIELAELPAPNSPSPSRQEPGNKAIDAADTTGETHDTVRVIGTDGEARPVSWASARDSQRLSRPAGPEVIPLPFQIPVQSDERDDDDRSSFATFADDDDRSIAMNKRASRASLGNRLSVGSGHLLHRLSRGSIRSTDSRKRNGEFSPTQLSHAWGGSEEDLVSEKPRRDSDAGSVAATIDGLSLDGKPKDNESEFAMEIMAELADKKSQGSASVVKEPADQAKLSPVDKYPEGRPMSTAETIATDILNMSLFGESADAASKRNSSVANLGKTEATSDMGQTSGASGSEHKADNPKKSASAVTSTPSTPASLTKDRLPGGLSRVASAYRTNEWAKHLSQAEVPEPQKLQEDVSPAEETPRDNETAAPVNVESLQQTAENGAPPPALTRSSSSPSSSPPGSRPVSQSNSRMSSAKSPGLIISTSSPQDSSAKTSPVSAVPPHALHTSHSFRMKSGVMSRRVSDIIGQPIAEEHAGDSSLAAVQADGLLGSAQVSTATLDQLQANARGPVPGIVSRSTPQTLLGRREMLLRNKSSILSPPIPEATTYSPQPAASEAGSMHNYPMYSTFAGQDADDLPLSQRKQLMRQSSLLSVAGGNTRPGSNLSMASYGADATNFDSHQPQRHSTLPSQLARESQLASFRQSVVQDLRAVTPINSSREITPSASTLSLNRGVSAAHREAELQRSMEQSRSMLLSQREQEAQRKEMDRLEKERNERMFEEHMRSGYLMDAHRDAIRKMQSAAR
ncbi:uncharacterized protein JN550_000486 [Neoarthrinium moseri]|uniref:uncharacterized protein n=1 Tax=Neoarthrinium moseri TaxID=1658444 RepID=UPI001FDE71C1|nr:uncharacterized protein JN550_000486 [Neoarthrinium moseri]KAI1878304.1 hypothetical protein JN550_000486 [Neoarthrinium moseri]